MEEKTYTITMNVHLNRWDFDEIADNLRQSVEEYLVDNDYVNSDMVDDDNVASLVDTILKDVLEQKLNA
jgi:hypothetical protein